MNARRSLETLCLTLCCLAAAGCGVGGEGQPPNGHSQAPLPGTDPCASVDVTRCDGTAGCQLVTTCPTCSPGQACPTVCQVECRSSTTSPPSPPPSQCAGLDEAACAASSACVPRYGGVCPPCAPGTACPPCTSSYLGCDDAPPPPPPSRCAGLDETTCRATPACQAMYGGACPACLPGGACPPCTSGYLGCTDAPPPPPPSRCAGLGERSCVTTPACQPIYGGACPACAPGSACPPCTSSYLGCVDAPQDHCTGLGERACNQASGCQGVYGTCPPNARCACPVGVDCTTEPALFVACQPDLGVCPGVVNGVFGGPSPGGVRAR